VPPFYARPFRDRRHAGQVLAERLSTYADRVDVIVLALPRGGVPVGFEVASALHVPLDIFVVRKLGVPGREELAMGAIASGGVRILNDEVIRSVHLPPDAIDRAAESQALELERRERLYRDDRSLPDLRDLTVVLVDDGLATGSSMRAAVQALRQHGPARTVVAVPVAAADTCRALRPEVDEVVCALTPEPFYAVGQWYEEFDQTSDDEVRDLLQRSSRRLVRDGGS
jgi:putative phosphoribosyl transferase